MPEVVMYSEYLQSDYAPRSEPASGDVFNSHIVILRNIVGLKRCHDVGNEGLLFSGGIGLESLEFANETTVWSGRMSQRNVAREYYSRRTNQLVLD
jgi:hypothetical protein